MNSYAGRRQTAKRSFRWLNLLVFVIVLFFCIKLGGQVQQYFVLNKEISEQQEKLAVAEAEYEAQTANEEMLYDDAYIEQIARERLGMVKEGEEAVSILAVDANE